MSRARADLLLLLVAIIWGTTFIAQKTGAQMGPFSFAGTRFLFSLLVVLPFAWRETRGNITLRKRYFLPALLLCSAFTGGVLLQQIGIRYTSIANSGFLTGLTVILVPIIEMLLFKRLPHRVVWIACFISMLGIWLLNGATLVNFNLGDILTIGCAVCFALQISVIGYLIHNTGHPVAWAALEYAVCCIIGLGIGIFYEHLTLAIVIQNLGPLLYAGVVSGGVAYTLQGVAQQYTSASKAALITSSEALFAAISGVLILQERLAWLGWLGCAFIFAAMCLAELPGLMNSESRSRG